MKSKEFLPIYASPVVVKNGPTCVGTIFAGPHHHTAGLRPPTFNPFTVRSAGSFCVVETVHDLATVSMSG